MNKNIHKIIITTFIVCLFTFTSFGTANAALKMPMGEFFEDYIPQILDDFMLKQKFSIPNMHNGKPKYTIEKKTEFKDGRTMYTLSENPTLLVITVDNKTDLITNFILRRVENSYNPNGPGSGPKDKNELINWHKSWTRIVASRYGNPQETRITSPKLESSFSEKEKYEYFVKANFDTSSAGQGRPIFQIEIRAL